MSTDRKPAFESSDLVEASQGPNLPVLIQTDAGLFEVISSGTQQINGVNYFVLDTRRA